MKTCSVCHITSVHPTYDIRIFYKECITLAENGFQVHLVAPSEKFEEYKGVNIHPIPFRAEKRISRMSLVGYSAIKKALEIDAEIYHLHDPELLLHVPLLKLKGKKVIFDSHEDLARQVFSKEYLPRYTRSVIARSVGLIENIMCRQIDAIVTATPSISKRFEGINPKVVNVSNFPFVNELSDIEVTTSKESAVCYIGSIAKVRGIETVVDAINNTDAKLILAGNIADPGLEKILESKPGWARVEKLGYVDRNGVANAMGRSIAGLVTLLPVPNHIEAIPIKMFEYLSMGIPIIASDFKLWRELLSEHDCALFVDPCDPRSISTAINWMTENREKAIEMGRRGKSLVKTQYNWEQESKKLVNLYQELSKR